MKIITCLARALWIVGLALAAMAPPAQAQSFADPLRAITPALKKEPFPQPDRACEPDKLPNPLPLHTAVDIALCNNPATRNAWAALKAAAAEVGLARSNYLPDLTATGSVARQTGGFDDTSASGFIIDSPDTTRSVSLSLNWLLFDFGNRAAQLDEARQNLLGASAGYRSQLQQVALGVIQNYLTSLATRALLDAAMQNEDSVQQTYNASKARYEAGVGTKAAMLQAETAYAQAVLDRTRTQGSVAISDGQLATSLSISPDSKFTFPDQIDELDVAYEQTQPGDLLKLAIRNNPDVARAQAALDAAQARLRNTRTQTMPRLSLSTSDRWTNQNNITDGHPAIALSVQVPLFTGFNHTYQKRASEAAVDQSQASYDLTVDSIAGEVWTRYQELITQRAALAAADKLLASATESERVAAGRYDAGVGTLIDLQTAQSALASARAQRIQSELQLRTAKATLATAVGDLDVASLRPAAP